MKWFTPEALPIVTTTDVLTTTQRPLAKLPPVRVTPASGGEAVPANR